MILYRIAALAAAATVVAVPVSPASAFDWRSVLGMAAACEQGPSPACVVAGAEQDDPATIAARALKGTGPDQGIASDRRIVTDAVEVGRLDSGIRVYAFKYLWENKIRVGVLAQDLLERADTRNAVLTLSNGLLGVDYVSLGLRMATEGQFKEHGLAALRADYKPAPVRAAKLDEPVTLYNRRAGQ